jgi:hypothetical protein
MPFTFCHPAIILPLNRFKNFSLTGLVAGSIAPDFEYFIRMTDKRVYTHTWSGFLWIDTPLALLLTFLFHSLVRNPLIHNAPIDFQRRLFQYKFFNWTLFFKKHWLMVTASIIIGIISHLAWDGFTHENGYFVRYLPLLTAAIPVGTFHLAVHMLLQVVCSIIGGLVIFYALWQLPADPKASVNTNYFSFWKNVALITIAIFTVRLLSGISNEIEDIAIPAISAFLIALIFMAAFSNKLSE